MTRRDAPRFHRLRGDRRPAGTCPGPILTQIGQGVPWALSTAVGMVAGVYLFLRRHQPETEPAADATPPDMTLAYQH